MDLNQLPRDTFDFPSNLEIRVICRKKVNCRDFLIRKYGEERYNAIVGSLDPLLLANVSRYVVIMYILYN